MPLFTRLVTCVILIYSTHSQKAVLVKAPYEFNLIYFNLILLGYIFIPKRGCHLVFLKTSARI